MFIAAPYFASVCDFGRIVGGKEATQAISYQITVYPGMESLCGGTMLDEWTVLTAAHCFPTEEGGPTAANTKVQAGALKIHYIFL
jgi:secreted trypsin-like serine protease